MRKIAITMAWGAMCMLGAGSLGAQASYVETFDDLTGALGEINWAQNGPQPLIDRGWTFRNQSEPIGDSPNHVWQGGDLWPAQSGTGYLAVKSGSAQTGGVVSQWAILPEIAGQAPGDRLVFHARRLLVDNEDVLEVRYAPGGGTDTGTTATDVGDFTDVLLSLAPPNDLGWQNHAVNLPGPGRIALRYVLDWVRPFQYSYIGIDEVSVGGAAPPCNQPAAPQPGKTVTWTAVGSPWEICGDVTIPPTATVRIEAGAQVLFEKGKRLSVQGRLEIEGTPGDPAILSSPDTLEWALRVQRGELAASHAELDLWIWADLGGSLSFADCRFPGNGKLESHGRSLDPWVAPYLDLRRCELQGAALDLEQAILAVRDTSFAASEVRFERVYLLLDGLDVRDAPGPGLEIAKSDQPFLVDNVSVTGAAGPGLYLTGSRAGNDFLVGPGVVLQGNENPVTLAGGGFAPGSALPLAGNDRDVVLWDSERGAPGPRTWPDLGLPYVVDSGTVDAGGPWWIHPGVRLYLGPGASLSFGSFAATSTSFGNSGPLLARGLPGAPIEFLPLVPGSPWNYIAAAGEGDRFEHCRIEGGENGISAPASFVHVQSSLLRDNGIAAHASGLSAHLSIEGSRIEDNAIGVDSDPSLLSTTGGIFIDGFPNPNSLSGNGIAVRALASQEVSAHTNWWGDPSGPQGGDNPAGTGDPVEGGVFTRPFLASPPDLTNAPPRVDLRRRFFLAEPGATIVLDWDAVDDEGIVLQRVLFNPSFNPRSRWFDLVDVLPPDQRSYVWTAPDIGLQNDGGVAYIRLEAEDAEGRRGWDEIQVVIPGGGLVGSARITSDLSGPFRAGDETQICYELVGVDDGLTGEDAWLLLEGDGRRIFLDNGYRPCLVNPVRMPYVSTDTARVGLRMRGGGCCNNVVWNFSDCFEIRPDPRIGDDPPWVELTSPLPGELFASGTPVDLAWEAGDDEGIRSFDVQVSFDAGRTWHVLASEIPGTDRGHLWTPPAELEGEVAFRVIVHDHRFQSSSSSCYGVPVTLGPTCDSDLDGDGYGDPSDPDCPGAGAGDCDDDDRDVWAPPGETGTLRYVPDKETLGWGVPAEPGGRFPLYDVLRTQVASDFEGATSCLESADVDRIAVDPERPGPAGMNPAVFYYLVRARNTCMQGVGPLGSRSDGTPRRGRDCP